jgi:membrane protein required for colicin V production
VWKGGDKTDDAKARPRYTRRARMARAPDSADQPSPDTADLNPKMPITILDIILLAVMFISAMLAMVRGFMREILSIAAWAAAAIATVYLYPRLEPVAKGYFNNDIVAKAVVIVGVFLATLLIVSAITVKISDMVLDSRIGALDRSLGFLFGLARGLLIVVIAFLFFDWLVPAKSQPEWVRNAKSKVVLQGTGDWLKAQLPDDPEGLYQKYKKRRDEAEPQDAPAGQRSDFGNGLNVTNTVALR